LKLKEFVRSRPVVSLSDREVEQEAIVSKTILYGGIKSI